MTSWPEPSSGEDFASHRNSTKANKPKRRNIGFTSMDILSGRGGLANTHQGNRIFRRLVALNKQRYQGLTSKHEKALLVDSIILTMQKHGGRFLQFNNVTGCWDQEISYKQAVQKTGQALREQDKGDRREVERALPSSRPGPKPAEPAAVSVNTNLTFSGDSDYPTSLMQLVMPALRAHQSACHPETSKIVADLGEERPRQGLGATPVEPVPPPPPLSFDEILQRQESLGLSGALRMPALSREHSLTLPRQESLGLSSALRVPDLGRETSLSFIYNNIDI